MFLAAPLLKCLNHHRCLSILLGKIGKCWGHHGPYGSASWRLRVWRSELAHPRWDNVSDGTRMLSPEDPAPSLLLPWSTHRPRLSSWKPLLPQSPRPPCTTLHCTDCWGRSNTAKHTSAWSSITLQPKGPSCTSPGASISPAAPWSWPPSGPLLSRSHLCL